ncbi:hypothetical protein [uncultured Fusobacterium sp.]|uniref:hypothetical protein n=1 Tax=uncultured Fusobacterium sp. TaxID=159267 RepID=UPI0025E2B56A|nr:hypothetical protein [uncultured Fusobacterium sp.]
MKKFIKRNIKEIYVLSILITIFSMQLAYEIRGYLTFGGEVLIPLLPVILHIWSSDDV